MYRYFLQFLFLLFVNQLFAQKADTTKNASSKELGELIISLDKRIKELESPSVKEKDLFKNIQMGLSFGFNGYINGPKSYYVKSDSTMGAYGKTRGVTGMLSALVGYKLSKKHVIYLNIPLSDLTNGANQTIGIFNKKVAGGLGYGYNIDKISIIGVINMYPYESIAVDVLEGKKFGQEEHTTLSMDGLPTESLVSPSITIGVCYNFLRAKEMILPTSK